MNAQPQDVQSILARIEVLERQNRRLKQIAVGGLLLVATVAVMGASSPTRTIEAQRFLLTDNAGRTRAVLGMEKDNLTQRHSPALTLYTENGKPGLQLIEFGLDSPLPELQMLDANGKDAVQLSHVGLLLNDTNSNSYVGLVVSGHPSLTMEDAFTPIVTLGIGAGQGTEPRLVIWDKQGFASTLGVTTLTDIASGTKRLTSAASLVMENKAGTILWSTETAQQQIDALGAYVGSIRPGYMSPEDVQRELDEFKDAACPILRRADGGMKLSYACGLH